MTGFIIDKGRKRFTKAAQKVRKKWRAAKAGYRRIVYGINARENPNSAREKADIPRGRYLVKQGQKQGFIFGK